MKKRLICLLLSAIMILCCFAGCAEKTGTEIKEKIGEEASEGAVTLSMYLMSEAAVSAKQEALMEEKVNEITEPKFKIRLDLRYFTPDQYYAKLEEHLAYMKTFYAEGTGAKTTDVPKYVDENGIPIVHYPKIESFDVDLFYFGGYDKYLDYKSKGYLTNLNEEISGSSKALKSVINSNLLDAFKTANKDFYAVPTNRAIGEYTYLLLNKQVLKDTQYSAADIKSLVSDECQDILQIVDEYKSNEYVPLYSSTGKLDLQDVKFFGAKQNGLLTNDFSVIGGTYNSDMTYGELNSFAEMRSILSSDDNGYYGIKEQISILKSYEFNGYYATDAEKEQNKPFAVGCIKGGFGAADEYAEDYEIVPISYPTIQTDDLYESMFGVNKLSSSSSASMKILTFLNTDETFRNLILYGVAGENYTFVDSDVLDENGKPYRIVERQTKDADKLYVMDALKTGNVALAYTAVGEDPKFRENMLDHNFDLKLDLTLGFSFYDAVNSSAPSISAETHAQYIALNEFSAEIYDKIISATSASELEQIFEEIEQKLAQPEFAQLLSKDSTSNSHAAYYYKWLEGKKLYKPETAEQK